MAAHKDNKRWYNNGEVSEKFIPGTQPEGFILGKLKVVANVDPIFNPEEEVEFKEPELVEPEVEPEEPKKEEKVVKKVKRFF